MQAVHLASFCWHIFDCRHENRTNRLGHLKSAELESCQCLRSCRTHQHSTVLACLYFFLCSFSPSECASFMYKMEGEEGLLPIVPFHHAPVEPRPPFLALLASSEYVIPYGMKIACMKPSPAFMDTSLSSLPSLVTLAKMCPSLSEP